MKVFLFILLLMCLFLVFCCTKAPTERASEEVVVRVKYVNNGIVYWTNYTIIKN